MLAPLRGFDTPVADIIRPMPLPAMQRMLDAGFPDGALSYWRASFVHGLTDDVIDAIVKYGNRMASPLSRDVDRILRRCGAGRPGELGLRPAVVGLQSP